MNTQNNLAPGEDLNPLPPVNHNFLKRKYLDVAYATISKAQKLDLYLPDEDGKGPFPTIVFMHGGAFYMCDKADCQVQPYLYLVKQGYAVASLNYRLSTEAVFPAGVHDVKAAVRFLRANAQKYGLDPARFAAAGGSAGGYYATMLCALSGRTELEDRSLGNPEYSSDVQAGVAWYPPTSFLQMDKHLAESGLHPQNHSDPDSPESNLMGAPITQLGEASLAAASPLSYVHKDMPPLLLQHGRADSTVPYQQSGILAKKTNEVAGGGRATLEIFDTAEHADAQFETEENMGRILHFLRKTLQ